MNVLSECTSPSIRDSLEISKSSLSCKFCQISRDCNSAARASAKLPGSFRRSFLVIIPTFLLVLLIFTKPIVLLYVVSQFFSLMKVRVIKKRKKKECLVCHGSKLFIICDPSLILRHKSYLMLLPITKYSSMPGVLLGLTGFELQNLL